MMQGMKPEFVLRRRIKVLLGLFVIGLVLSGVTAFPLEWELNLLAKMLGAPDNATPEQFSGLTEWIVRVRNGLRDTYAQYPFIAYGTDWLAFAHLTIATAFWGPWRDPVRNRWVVEWGIISCVAIFPLAFICGPLRGIPFYWQLIDCAFGVFGAIPLWLCLRDIKQLEDLKHT
jgi:hypothetical protein